MKRTMPTKRLLNTRLSLILAAVLILMATNISPSANAAVQTTNLDLTANSSDNPLFNSETDTTASFNGIGITNNSTEASGSSTSLDSDLNHIYTWRLSPSDSICSEATLQGLSLSSTASAEVEGNPDLSAMMLYAVEPSRQYNVGNYTITSGVDYADVTGFFTPPNNLGIYGVIRGTATVFGGSIAGVMEATWDVSSFPIGTQFGVMVQQDTEDGTSALQTTIDEAILSYDDSECAVVSPLSTTPTPSSPKTGDAISMISATAAATAAIFLILRTAKKLKAKH
jgi:hypothetical protein